MKTVSLWFIVLGLFFGNFSFFVPHARAEGIELGELVELFITLGIIPKEKETEARSVIAAEAKTGTVFTRNLTLGSSGSDVRVLQELLNKNEATVVSQTGPGSPGKETIYFGSLTKKAVLRFQELYKEEILTPVGLLYGTGYVGDATRAKLNAIGSQGNENVLGGEGATLTNESQSYFPDEKSFFDGSKTPTIFFPSEYDGASGKVVRLSGSGFAPASNTFTFGTNYTEILTASSSSELLFRVPDLPVGRYGVSVTNANGTSNEVIFTITDPGGVTPVIEKISPTAGKTGTVVTIIGSGFKPTGNVIYTGYNVIENATSSDGKTLTFTMLPPGLSGGALLTRDSNEEISLSTWEFSDVLKSEHPEYFEDINKLAANTPEYFWIYVENTNGLSNNAIFEYYLK